MKELKKLKTNYYLYEFFYQFVLAYVIYSAFFVMEGLEVYQVSILLALWGGIGLIAEVPSGALEFN